MSIARVFTWPIRRLLDPRFGGLAQQADAQHQDLVHRFEALHEYVANKQTLEHGLTRMGDVLTGLARAENEATREAQELMARSLGDLLAEATQTTSLLRSMTPANPGGSPVVVAVPYALRALARLEPGRSILVLTYGEGALALALASLGYDVTALGGPPAVPHPRLRSVDADMRSWKTDETFDAVIALSPVEDGTAETLSALLAPRGLLVSWVPLNDGPAEAERLLNGWTIEDLTVATKQDGQTWAVIGGDGSATGVALVTATRPA